MTPQERESPHAHWSPFDEGMEMAVFNEVHRRVEAGEGFDDLAADLSSRAQSYGYAQADSFLCDVGGNDPEDESAEDSARREVYENYMDNDEYWENIDRSERVLSSIPDTPERSIRAVTQGMRDSFETGRRMRTEESPSPSPR